VFVLPHQPPRQPLLNREASRADDDNATDSPQVGITRPLVGRLNDAVRDWVTLSVA
jgi:hypothetical protein